LIAAIAIFALKAAEWFRLARLFIVAPDSPAQPCQPSGSRSTYRTVRICGATSSIPGQIGGVELEAVAAGLIRAAWVDPENAGLAFCVIVRPLKYGDGYRWEGDPRDDACPFSGARHSVNSKLRPWYDIDPSPLSPAELLEC
jgi:hypothetical protein